MAGFLTRGSIKDPRWTGLIAENVAACHIRRLKFNVEGVDEKLFFWFDSKGEDVDVVQSFKGETIPFEVKYRNAVRRRDLADIRRFSAEFNCKMSVVITSKELKREGETVFIPL